MQRVPLLLLVIIRTTNSSFSKLSTLNLVVVDAGPLYVKQTQSTMTSQTTHSNSIPPFPSPQTFDILPQIYDLITRLPSSIPTSTTATAPQASISDPLDLKDLLQAAVPIKLKIQKAKAVVSALPNVDQTIEEQEDDIRELERRVTRLKSVMGELGRRAGAGIREAKEDGTEGRDEG